MPVSFLKKVAKALFGGGEKDKKSGSAQQQQKDQPKGRRHHQIPKHQQSRPASGKPSGNPRRDPSGRPPADGKPRPPRQQPAENGDASSRQRQPINHRSSTSARPARPPRPQQQQSPRGTNTARGQMRPGGSVGAEEHQKRLDAHKAWNPADYQIPVEEGKTRFADLNLPNEVMHAVADLGFKYCTPIQALSLEHALAGKNVTGKAQTGTGKTAAFLIAILTRYLRNPEGRSAKGGQPRALVIAPTRELVIQICKDADTLGKYCGDIRSLAVYGGMDYERQKQELHDAPVDLLVATPGRLLDFCRGQIIDLSKVDTLVIDEADRMLDMGFIPDVKAIVRRLPAKENRCTMLYSATLDDDVLRLALQWMHEPVKVEIESEAVTVDTVKQIVYIVTAKEKFTVLYNHIKQFEDARMIIFCNRKSTTEHLADNLRRFGISCETLSGDVHQNKRLRVLEDFREGKIRTVVATDVAGRGIHVDDIAFVVNYDFPYEAEDYVHRIGRTGRAGNTGTAISFADENESFTIPEIEKYINEPLKCTLPAEELLKPLPTPPPVDRNRARSHSDESEPRPPRANPEQEAKPAEVPVAVAPAPAPVVPVAPAPQKREERPAPPPPRQQERPPRPYHQDRDRHAPREQQQPKPVYLKPTSGGEVWSPGE